MRFSKAFISVETTTGVQGFMREVTNVGGREGQRHIQVRDK